MVSCIIRKIDIYHPDSKGRMQNDIEGELLPLDQVEVKFIKDLGLFGPVPIDFCHIIDSTSPFYQIGPAWLENSSVSLEFVVTVSEAIASTGTTYLSKTYSRGAERRGYIYITVRQISPLRFKNRCLRSYRTVFGYSQPLRSTVTVNCYG